MAAPWYKLAMNRRNATRDVWRAVVFAGAMLGCGSSSKPPPAEPVPQEPTTTEPGTPEPVAAAPDAAPEPVAAPAPPDAAPPPPPDAAPAKRPRKSSGKPEGRGFLLV